MPELPGLVGADVAPASADKCPVLGCSCQAGQEPWGCQDI